MRVTRGAEIGEQDCWWGEVSLCTGVVWEGTGDQKGWRRWQHCPRLRVSFSFFSFSRCLLFSLII